MSRRALAWAVAAALAAMALLLATGQYVAAAAVALLVPLVDAWTLRRRLAALNRQMADLNRQLAERRDFNQTRRDFVANVSHDLRTPLTAILGAAEALGQRPGAGELQPMLGIITRQARRLEGLAGGLLALSKLESGPEPANFKSVPAGRLLSEAAANHPGAQFALEVPEGLPPLFVDRAAVAGALGNFIDNALKYGRPGAPIILRATEEPGGRFLRLAVENEGPPIPEDERARLFERFYRGSHSRSAAGAGLGLSIARHVALNHGGDAAVECPPGRVAFSLTLPCRGARSGPGS